MMTMGSALMILFYLREELIFRFFMQSQNQIGKEVNIKSILSMTFSRIVQNVIANFNFFLLCFEISELLDKFVKGILQNLMFNLDLFLIKLVQNLIKISYESYFETGSLRHIQISVFLQDLYLEAFQCSVVEAAVLFEVLENYSPFMFVKNFHFEFFLSSYVILT